MPTILIVEKIGTIKELNVKTFAEDELYKKAGFKTAEGFKMHATWEIDGGLKISVYGKTSGKANQENKYEFPPPIDNALFFGNCIITCKSADEDKPESITAKDWEGIYETLYGGFEDIGDEDSDEEDEDDEDEALPRTKTGYVKDDFVVDDGEEEEEEEDEEEDEDEDDCEAEIEYVKKPKKKAAPAKRKPTGKKTLFEKINTTEDPNVYLDCTNELEEEDYL
jgi:hypothetical protein